MCQSRVKRPKTKKICGKQACNSTSKKHHQLALPKTVEIAALISLILQFSGYHKSKAVVAEDCIPGYRGDSTP
jgi:hypothetical protein